MFSVIRYRHERRVSYRRTAGAPTSLGIRRPPLRHALRFGLRALYGAACRLALVCASLIPSVFFSPGSFDTYIHVHVTRSNDPLSLPAQSLTHALMHLTVDTVMFQRSE